MASTSHYMVGVTIGEGAFGVTLHGRHKASGREVAIKVVDKWSLSKRPALLSAVVQEQRILYRLRDSSSHPFVVSLWASFDDAQAVYFVMECCQGGTLAHLLAQGPRRHHHSPPWSTRTAPFHYGYQILQALHYIHSRHVAHCDLKPENILLTGSTGRIKLADFGAAWDSTEPCLSAAPTVDSMPLDEGDENDHHHEQNRHTRQDAFCCGRAGPIMTVQGTMDYSSPEILNGALFRDEWGKQRHPSPASGCSMEVIRTTALSVDAWSYGCLLFALMVGESPFHAASDSLAMEKIRTYVEQRRKRGEATEDIFFLLGRAGTWPNYPREGNNGVVPMEWMELIHKLLDPTPTQRVLVLNTCDTNSVWRSVNLDQNADFVPPPPEWVEAAQETEMRDGNQGWSAFLL